MAYTTQALGVGEVGSEAITPTAKQLGVIDRGLVDHEARIVALEAALVALAARVTVLEQAP